ncbi:MAG: triose-phosphate isomerase [Gemmatimonadales bacterium]|nr:triose-phosphate isomerase [Gemmatimonadales bacterium]
MTPTVYAGNWKMHHGPDAARQFARTFTSLVKADDARELWLFAPAVSLGALAEVLRGRPDVRVGAQDVHWEPKGAFTGALSIPLVREVGASGALVGHSERRHLFRETDEEAGRKVQALLEAGMTAMLCVGEQLAEREAGETLSVVRRQLDAGLGALRGADLARLRIAYEPVWAIGTGKVATPDDAAAVHAAIRAELAARDGLAVPILYGGSVNLGNALGLLAREEIDGVLVGGASLDAEKWAELVGIGG